jgi:hypothetical protein
MPEIPDPANSSARRVVLLVAGFMAALAVLGVATQTAFDKWSWVTGLFSSSRQKPPLSEASQTKNNTMGTIQDNKGIVTQGQSGDNTAK